MTIPWRSEYSVGIGKIDEQHQHFLELLNELYEYIGNPNTDGQIGGVVNALFEYAGHHFETEEKYFDEFKYPAAAEHKMEHEKLLRKTKKFKDQFESGKLDIPEFVDFLENWLVDHLEKQDSQYADFFHKHGLK